MRISRFICSVLLMFLTFEICAQNYSVNAIPDSLLENANYVIRDYTREIELQSINSSVERIRMVITILNKQGEDNVSVALHHDNNSSVNIKQIILYDKNGEKIKNVKQSEITDYPISSSSELFSESRMKYYKPNYAEYPYSVEYIYEKNVINQISYGCWMPVDDYNLSLQHARLTLIHPADVKINKKEINITQTLSEPQKNKIVETWNLNNFKAIEEEPFSISIAELVPCVYLMPDKLIYEKYKGSANNWQEFGKWVNDLYQDRDLLSEAEITKVRELIREIPDTLECVRALYKYMQENTRYVAITLGIGGYQPFDASTVFETGYGDCKALSNYLHSLLKLIGVKSYSVLVSGGSYKVPIFKDFPNFSQFNHVILCVPQKKDTIWLECTNQKIPFGFLGDFTDDRDVLLITENGGQFAHTKRYNASDNLRICNSTFIIDPSGTATCSSKTRFEGLQYDNLSFLLSFGYEEQKKWLYSNSTLPSLQINEFSVDDLKDSAPAAIVSESSVSKNFCTFSGKYMLLSLNLINAQKPVQKMLKPRFSDILINSSFLDYDTLVYQIPEGYTFESVPPGKIMNSKFGDYSSAITSDENKVIFTRRFLINQGRFSPNEYSNFRDFILNVSKADNVKLMLTKKPETK